MFNFSYVLRYHAERSGDRPLIKFHDTEFTYAETNERVDAVAQALKDLGLGRGDIVGILMYNCHEFLETTFAVNRIGGVFLPLNYRLAGDELAYIINHAGAKALVTEKDFVPVVESIQPQLESVAHYISLGTGDREGWLYYDQLLANNRGARVPDVECREDDLHRIMYTSGTTSRPKGVMLTYGNLYWKNIGHVWEMDLTAEDKVLMAGPMYHCGAFDLPGTAVIHRGGSVVAVRKFDAAEVLAVIERDRPTIIWLAPAMIIQVLQDPSLGKRDLASIRCIIDGGEKMPEALIEKLQEAFPNAWFADAYGLTETVSGDTFLDKESTFYKLGSVGKPVIHLDVKIVDDDGHELPAGELGEICLKGPKVFKGYWRNPEATAEAVRDGWFHTGDIGKIDEEGYLYIVDRKKDMIISGGENIASPEVERVLYEHPAVVEAAVVGKPDPRWGEVPRAFVVRKAGSQVTGEELIEFCKTKLAKYKVPKEVVFLDSLPRNPSGKVLKRELKQRIEG